MLSRVTSALSLILILLPLLPFLGGCGGPGDGTSEKGAAEGRAPALAAGDGAAALARAAQALITVGAMEVELDSIVQYDRLSGSPGEIAAVDYLVRTLEEEGIEVAVDTFLAFISDPVSATVAVPGTDFAPEAITVSGSGDVQNLQAPLVDLGNLGDLPPFLTETGERFILDADGPTGSEDIPTYPNLQGQIAA